MSINNEKILEIMIKGFYPYSKRVLGFDRDVKILLKKKDTSENPLTTTAYYNPDRSEISLLFISRHPKDVLRSLSHELVHHYQNCNRQFNPELISYEEGYCQKNKYMRRLESEAYEKGNLIFRDWEDMIKNKMKNKNNDSQTTTLAEAIDLFRQELNKKFTSKILKEDRFEKYEKCYVDDSEVQLSGISVRIPQKYSKAFYEYSNGSEDCIYKFAKMIYKKEQIPSELAQKVGSEFEDLIHKTDDFEEKKEIAQLISIIRMSLQHSLKK